MKIVRNILMFALFLFAGTHAVRELRLSFLGFSTPYSVLLFYILLCLTLPKVVASAAAIRFSSALLFAFCVYYISILISSIFAVHLDGEVLLKWLLFPLMPICISLSVDRVQLLKIALVLFGISGFAVFCYGIYGFITWDVGDPLQHALGYFGITYEESSRNGDVLYLQSTFWILSSITLFANKASKLLRAFCGLLAVMVVIGLALSLARGAWISGALTVLALAAIQRSIKSKFGDTQKSRLMTKLLVFFLLFTAFLYVLTAVLGPEYQELLVSRIDSISTLSEDGGNSNLARTLLLMKAADVALTHPLGVGVWNLKYYLTDFYIPGLASAENIYLHLFAEQGILGLGSYLFILGLIGKRLYLYIAICGDSADRWVGLCLICVLINWSIYGMFNIMIETLWYWLGISLAVAAGNLAVTRGVKKVVEAPTFKPMVL